MSKTDFTQYAWRKSSRSNTRPESCVELPAAERAVAVRDSKNPGGSILQFTRSDWSAFTRRIKDGTFQGS